MRSTLTAALLTLAFVLAACGGDSDGNSSTRADPPSGALLHYERAGGIGYTALALTVQDDGEAKLTSTTGTNATFTLTGQEMDALQRALDEHPVDSLGEPGTTEGCADCIAYSAEYAGGSYEADSASVSDQAQELFGEFETLIQAHTPKSQSTY